MKITVVGIGYVGLSNAVLLAQNNEVAAVDLQEEKVALVNQRKSPIADPEIESYLAERNLQLEATTDAASAYRGARFIVVATPTDYDPDRDYFNTDSVEKVIDEISQVNPAAAVVIKSTIPLGFTKAIRQKYPTLKILFFPEFLREGQALYDNLHPTRIVAGIPENQKDLMDVAHEFTRLLQDGAIKKDIPVMIVDSTEAEAIKLFANTYLAMRVSFFNELDTYAETCGLSARNIIEGVCMDPRIGTHYNNPSFGYGGYCLPKDTKQLLANYRDIPEKLITAIVESNKTRKEFVARQIIEIARQHSKEKGESGTVGVYRLAMKAGSDNFRQSSMLDDMRFICSEGIEVLVYEPRLKESAIPGVRLMDNLPEFKNRCDVIIANRFTPELSDCKEKVYTRDIYLRD